MRDNKHDIHSTFLHNTNAFMCPFIMSTDRLSQQYNLQTSTIVCNAKVLLLRALPNNYNFDN